MLTTTLATLIVALAQAGAPASADAATVVAGVQKAALAKPALTPVQVYSEKRICRPIVVTGTRFSQQECHTALEWDQQARDGADTASYIQNRANSFCFNAATCKQ